MKTLEIAVTKNIKARKSTFTVEFDADRFERIAAALGMFSDEFLASLDRAEKEVKAGKTKKLHSLKDLR